MNKINLFQQLEKGVNHAYILEGGFPCASEDFIKTHRGGKDAIFLIERDILRIEDVRELSAQATRKQDVRTILILRAHSILHEAQNALLKALEEPSEGVIYLLHIRTSYALIPTLVSRCQILHAGRGMKEQEETNLFLSLSPIKRLAYISHAMESEGHHEAYSLLHSLTLWSEQRCLAHGGIALSRIHEMVLMTEIAASRHPIGLKQSLEHLSLTLPSQ